MKGEQFGPDKSAANQVINSWQPVTIMAPQGYILRLVLLNIFICDLSVGLESVLRKFGDYIGGTVESIEGGASLAERYRQIRELGESNSDYTE